MPGLSCQYGTCVAAASADAGPQSSLTCGGLGAACCALADGSQRCRDATLACDGATLTCVAATADELGGDNFRAPPRSSVPTNPKHRQACVYTDRLGHSNDVVGICAILAANGQCSGGATPRSGACSGESSSSIKCCPWGTADGSPSDNDTRSGTGTESEEDAMCRAARADSSRSLDLACRYDLGQDCGGGRTCLNTSSVATTDCVSRRCTGSSSTMCCRRQSTSAGTTHGGATPTDVNRRSTGQTCDFTGNGEINSADNAVCTADTSGRSCVSLRCLNAGHSVRCCRPRTGTTSSSGGSTEGVGASCNKRSGGSFVSGVCVAVDSSGESSSCFGTPESGYCPGPSTVRCCFD